MWQASCPLHVAYKSHSGPHLSCAWALSLSLAPGAAARAPRRSSLAAVRSPARVRRC